MAKTGKDLQELNVNINNEDILYQEFIKIDKNIELLNSFIDDFPIIFKKVEKYDFSDSNKTIDEVKYFFAYKLFDGYISRFCFYSYLFNDEKIKIICMLKSYISDLDNDLKKFTLNGIKKVLSDGLRFPFDSANYLIDEINKIDINKSFDKIKHDPFTYFTNNSSYSDITKVYMAIFSINGFIKSKEQVHSDYIKDNYSKELIEVISKSMPDINTKHLTPQKEIELPKPQKIDWKKDERLIPYLIHLLNENGYINEKHQFAFIEKHFIANGKPIRRENIKANYNQADYLNKHINKTPKDIIQINNIIEQLNSILNTLE